MMEFTVAYVQYQYIDKFQYTDKSYYAFKSEQKMKYR